MSLKVMLIILATLLVLLLVVALISTLAFKRKVEAEVVRLFDNALRAGTAVVTEADLAKLPSPIQRYLRHSLIVGKPKVQTVRLRQRGFFRRKPDQEWMPFEAEQYYTVNPPGFVWYARIQALPLINFYVRDMYADGKGSMLGRVMATVTVAEALGPELNHGALLRFLSEIIWFPTAWVSGYLTWEPIDSSSAKVTMTHGGLSASATIHISEAGDFVNFRTDRYMITGDSSKVEKWSTPVSDYGVFKGLRLPTKGEAVWNLPCGDYSYIKVEIVSVEYDKASVF